jgi:MFS family permease
VIDQPDPAETAAVRRRRFVDLTPLRVSPAFARLWTGGAIAGIGAMMTQMAVGLQVYELTESTLAVSLVGGIALVPMIVAGLWGGMLLDAFDRRIVLIASAIVGWVSVAALAALAWFDSGLDGAPVWPLYLLATVISVSSTIQYSARAATTPRILPPELVPAATALGGIGFGFQLTVGPALAGVLVAGVGFAWTYAVDVVLFTFGFLGIVTLPKLLPLEEADRPGWGSLKAGLSFLRRAPNIRASFLVDIVAMTFGRPYVLFPAVGALVLGGGPITVGILVAAGAVGTFLASLFSGPVGHVRRHGVAIAYSVMIYGGFALMFGVVVLVLQLGSFPEVTEDFATVNWVGLAFATIAQVGMGAADEISAIFRQTILVMAAPDSMRGRMQGIFTVVVTGGPRLGDLYMGILATAVALWFPAVIGGLLVVCLVTVLLRVVTSFHEYDALDPTP